MGNFGPFLANSGPIHGLWWSHLSLKYPFRFGDQCCFKNICPKIDTGGWSPSRWPSYGHFRPPRGLRWWSPKSKMLKIKFHSHLYKTNFALNCSPEAVLDGLVLLGVALKANLRDHPILVFWGPLTSPKTWKVVSFMVVFLPFSFLIWPHSVTHCSSQIVTTLDMVAILQ